MSQQKKRFSSLNEAFASAGPDGLLTSPEKAAFLASPDFTELLSSSLAMRSHSLQDAQLDEVLASWHSPHLSHVYDVYHQGKSDRENEEKFKNDYKSKNDNNDSKGCSEVPSKDLISQASASELLAFSNDAVIQYQSISNKIRKLKHLDETRLKQQREIASLLEDIIEIENHNNPSTQSSSSSVFNKSDDSRSAAIDVGNFKTLQKNMKYFEFKFLCKLLEISSSKFLSQDAVNISSSKQQNNNHSSSSTSSGISKNGSKSALKNPAQLPRDAACNYLPSTGGYDPATPLDPQSQRLLETINRHTDSYINDSIRTSIMSLSASAIKETKFYEGLLKQVAVGSGAIKAGGIGKASHSPEDRDSSNTGSSTRPPLGGGSSDEEADIETKQSLEQLNTAFVGMAVPYFDFNKLAHSFLLDSFLKRPVRIEDLESVVASVVSDLGQLFTSSSSAFSSSGDDMTTDHHLLRYSRDADSSSTHALIKQLLFGSNYDPSLDTQQSAEQLSETGPKPTSSLDGSSALSTASSPFSNPELDWQQLTALRSRHQGLLLRVQQAFEDFSPYHADIVLGDGDEGKGENDKGGINSPHSDSRASSRMSGIGTSSGGGSGSTTGNANNNDNTSNKSFPDTSVNRDRG